MSQEIIKILDELGKRFGVVIDWSNQNIMPYLQELGKRFITYKTATGILAIVICTAITILLSIAIIKMIKWIKSDDCNPHSDEAFGCAILIIFIGIAIIGLVIGIICNITGIMQNLIMPELTIIEYLKGMM